MPHNITKMTRQLSNPLTYYKPKHIIDKHSVYKCTPSVKSTTQYMCLKTPSYKSYSLNSSF